MSEDAKEWNQRQRDDSFLYHGVRLARLLEWRKNNETALNPFGTRRLPKSSASSGGTPTKFSPSPSPPTARPWPPGVASGEELANLPAGFGGGLYPVAFAPDGKMLASGILDTVKLWDAATGRELATLRTGHHVVLSLAFAPDSKTLASGGADETVKLWDTLTGKELATLKGRSDVFYVAFTRDGKTLVSGGGGTDGTIKLWFAAPEEEVAAERAQGTSTLRAYEELLQQRRSR